ncbi:MAG: hypothetical protein IPM18_02815 [Phycisphaerales bacterium]|nr:hypothetical protein [Phycisphaerales bacterium]
MVDDLPRMLLDTIHRHLTPAGEWVPLLVLASGLLLGILLLLRGARLAPYAAVAALALGGLGVGQAATPHVPLGAWVPPLAGGAVGLVLGVVLVRLWVAVLITACLAGGALTLYGAQVVLPAVESHTARGFNPTDPTTWVTLQEPPDEAATAAVQGGLPGLLSYLTESVPNFQLSTAAIVLSTGLAGLAFGLLLPKLARAAWAATLGTVLFLSAAYVAALLYLPSATPWLHSWGLVLAAVLWVVSAAGNWADLQGWLRRRPVAAPPPAAPPPAAA